MMKIGDIPTACGNDECTDSPIADDSRETERNETCTQVLDLAARCETLQSELAFARTDIAKRDLDITNLSRALDESEGLTRGLRRRLHAVRSSPSWWLSSPIRMATDAWETLRDCRHCFRSFRQVLLHNGRLNLRRARELVVVYGSGLFDEAFYLVENPDVAETGVNPLVHYILRGTDEGRDPHPAFNTTYYLESHAAVNGNGLNPLAHFIEYGAFQGFKPNPAFDPEYYLNENPDVLLAGINPLVHFIEFGAAQGLSTQRLHIKSAFVPPGRVNNYESWLCVNRWNSRCEEHLRKRLESRSGLLPRISIIMPVYNAPLRFLKRAIETVTEQVYAEWELCIADDASTDKDIISFLKVLPKHSDRIKVCFSEENTHISHTSNRAADMATGEFLLFLDQDDELEPDALGEIALYLAENAEADMVYSDSDKIDVSGKRRDPHFKPDWSPELLLSYMYCGQVLCVRRKLFKQLGGMRPGFEGSQDHDLALRLSEVARHIGHVPKVLYHWRCLEGSTAMSGNEKPYAADAGRRAVQAALERRGSNGTAFQPKWAAKNGNALFLHDFPDTGPLVTIIIPTRNHEPILRACLDSLRCTTYQNYEVLIIDNFSDDPATVTYLKGLKHRILRINNVHGNFNYSYLNNQAVAQANGELVLLLNDDTTVVEPRWLSRMVGYAQLPDVGAVGAQLRYPDGGIQHAGVLHGIHDGLPGHAFRQLPRGTAAYLGLTEFTRNCSAVTAACMLTPRKLFLEVGGLDEANFAVAYNDPDYCYRLRAKGWRIVYAGAVHLIHHEGKSRGFDTNPQEVMAIKKRYGSKKDTYFNPNLSLDNALHEVAPRHSTAPISRAMRVLAFSHNLNLEGAPKWQMDLLRGLKKRNVIDPLVVSPCDGPLRRDYEAAGISVCIRPAPPYHDRESYLAVVAGFREIFKEHRTELVHANTMQSFFAVEAARLNNLPTLWNIHESDPWFDYFEGLASGVEHCALGCFSYPYRVVFASHASRQSYEPLNSRQNFAVIHNALRLTNIKAAMDHRPQHQARQELGVEAGDVVFLVLGTVCHRKGQQDVVKALEQLTVADTAQIRIFIVGDRKSDYSRQLRTSIDDLTSDKRERITVVQETKDTALYYQAADVFLCCSRTESFPLVILEAMAYGLPIITTPVFGITEQVFEGYNADFYPPGDIPALLKTITTMLQQPERRELYGRRSPEVLSSISSYDEMCKAYSELFSEAFLSK